MHPVNVSMQECGQFGIHTICTQTQCMEIYAPQDPSLQESLDASASLSLTQPKLVASSKLPMPIRSSSAEDQPSTVELVELDDSPSSSPPLSSMAVPFWQAATARGMPYKHHCVFHSDSSVQAEISVGTKAVQVEQDPNRPKGIATIVVWMPLLCSN